MSRVVDVVDDVDVDDVGIVEDVEDAGIVVTAVASLVVVVVACFFPQSLRAASARFSFGCAATYCPWLRAFAHVTGVLAAPATTVVEVVDDGFMDDVVMGESVTTTTAVGLLVCAGNVDAPARTSTQAADPRTAAVRVILRVTLRK